MISFCLWTLAFECGVPGVDFHAALVGPEAALRWCWASWLFLQICLLLCSLFSIWASSYTGEHWELSHRFLCVLFFLGFCLVGCYGLVFEVPGPLFCSFMLPCSLSQIPTVGFPISLLKCSTFSPFPSVFFNLLFPVVTSFLGCCKHIEVVGAWQISAP